ncbi:MAG: hypothetical protein KUG80_07785 [Gammaproteobacteria bacterium]|nr:hypothetical protein [Gammaproteobacteria bacterium]
MRKILACSLVLLAACSGSDEKQVSSAVEAVALTDVSVQVDKNLVPVETVQHVQESAPALHLPPIEDQLICRAPGLWLSNGSAAYACIQASKPEEVSTPTFAEVLGDDWIAHSGGGQEYMIFYK